jgi:dihydroneopterin aldolase
MIKVGLHGAAFFARHGYYKEEQVLGNYFIVDIEAVYDTQAIAINDNLDNTLNYECLYQIAADSMKQPYKLLETVAQHISEAVMQMFPYISTLEVVVKKLNPPLKGKVAASSITVYVNNH